MRISDWSSDVCSSDLRCFQATVDHGMSWARLVCLGKTGPILERADGGERIGESYGTSTFTPEQIIAKLREADVLVGRDRKRTRLNSVTNAHLVSRLLLENKTNQYSS